MDEEAPISWLIGQVNAIVSSGAGAAAASIAKTVTPVVSFCFGIYIFLILINYLRGAESEPVIDFFMRIASFAIIVGLGLNAENYSDIVIPIVTGLGGYLANAVSGGTVNANTLDQLALHYFNILETGLTFALSGGVPFNIGPLIAYSFQCFLILVGLIPFLVAATVCLIVADVGSVLVAMVGPLFFAFLLFPATRQYFSAWLNTAFSYALIPVFVAVIATISVELSNKMFLADGGTLEMVSLKTVFMASMGNLVLLFLLKQVSSLASSLSAGGINASIPGGVGAAASSIYSGVRGSVKDARGAYRVGAALKERLANRGNSIRKAG